MNLHEGSRISRYGAFSGQKLQLLDLPNEVGTCHRGHWDHRTDSSQILLHALYTIPTLPLLCARAVNHRFRNLIEHIVHSRLLVAASLADWKLIVECYHPSSQYSEPYVFCEYLGTPALGSDTACQALVQSFPIGGLRGLKGIFAHFRPTLKTPETRMTHPHPMDDPLGSRTTEVADLARPSDEEPVKRTVNLDSYENFSQLMFNASLVRLGRRKGVFLDLADVLDVKTVRVFRDWLCRKAQAALEAKPRARDELGNEQSQGDGTDGRQHELVWVDESTKIAGLDIEVREVRRRDMPILISRDEDQPVGYCLELKGASLRRRIFPVPV
ncbi:MAG: hypothetical protein Q9217_005531 [Psora testacea]